LVTDVPGLQLGYQFNLAAPGLDFSMTIPGISSWLPTLIHPPLGAAPDFEGPGDPGPSSSPARSRA
jgi:hypothetical protein